jgi:hypothetical protein
LKCHTEAGLYSSPPSVYGRATAEAARAKMQSFIVKSATSVEVMKMGVGEEGTKYKQ